MRLRSKSEGDKYFQIRLNSLRMYRLTAGNKSSVLSSTTRKELMKEDLQKNGSSWLVKAFSIQTMLCSSRVLKVAHISQAQKVSYKKKWYNYLCSLEE